MTIDDVVSFCYQRNALWQSVDKLELKEFFKEFAPYTLIVSHQGNIEAVGVYLPRGENIVFISFTCNESIDAFRLISAFKRKFKDVKIEFINKEFELKCLQL